MWNMPTNPQRDIVKFQIFRRESLDEGFTLMRVLDFDNSSVRFVGREVINPDVVKKYLSNDGVLTTHSLRALMYYRVILFIAGVFLLFNNKIRDLCSSIEEKGLLPKKTFNLLFKLILI